MELNRTGLSVWLTAIITDSLEAAATDLVLLATLAEGRALGRDAGVLATAVEAELDALAAVAQRHGLGSRTR